MYGQTTGEGARALVGLRRSYPVAMAYLDAADQAAQVGTDLRTYGGRLVRMGSAALGEPPFIEAMTTPMNRSSINVMAASALQPQSVASCAMPMQTA